MFMLIYTVQAFMLMQISVLLYISACSLNVQCECLITYKLVIYEYIKDTFELYIFLNEEITQSHATVSSLLTYY